MEFWNNVYLELIKTGLASLTLGFGWFVGQRIIASWDIRKKHQELDIATATQFHKLYGEFKEVSRLWRTVCFKPASDKEPASGKKSAFPEGITFELLRRATAAEGGVEAIIVKLATEKDLKLEDIKTLGLFRQAYQKLRESIREDESLDWIYGTPEYDLYNDLASKTASIISSSKTKEWHWWQRRPKSDEAPDILRKITAIRSETWEEELKRLGKCS